MSLRRATGQAAFAGDIALPGMLHLAVRRSPLARARVARADAGAARALPGVAMVLVPGDGDSLLDPELRYVGDRLVVAAAEEPELARRAADAVEVELEALSPVLDAEAALAGGPPAARVVTAEGDVDAALAASDRVIEGEWSLPFSPAVALEPPLAVTWLDEDRRLVVRTTADSPFRVRGALAERLSLPAARIRVVRPHVAGGSLGRPGLAVEDLCALVTLRTGRPARLALSAEEELTTTPGRPAQKARVRIGLKDSRLAALDLRLLVDLGADGELAGELLRASARHALGLYRVPSVRFEGAAVRTNRPPASGSRGADGGAAFALECAVDEAATALGEEPAAFRRRHLRASGDAGRGALLAIGEEPGQDDARAAAELLQTLERGGGRPREADATGDSEGIRRARGFAVARRLAAGGGRVVAAATLRLLDDGSLTLAAGPSIAGADEAAHVDAAARVLGVPPNRLVCAAADTDTAPFEAGETASADFAAGHAVEEAALALRERILEAGAALLGVAPGEAAVGGGRVRAADREVSFAEVGASGLREGRPLAATAAPAPSALPPVLAAAAADVTVDAETGLVRVTRLGAAVVGGPFADARPARGQAEGALVGALELALAGGLPFDAEGRPAVRSLRRWPLATAGDVPPLDIVFVPSGDPAARFGAGAIGDAVLRAALAAIANAVTRAARAPVRVLPLAPGAVLDALEAARRP